MSRLSELFSKKRESSATAFDFLLFSEFQLFSFLKLFSIFDERKIFSAVAECSSFEVEDYFQFPGIWFGPLSKFSSSRSSPIRTMDPKEFVGCWQVKFFCHPGTGSALVDS